MTISTTQTLVTYVGNGSTTLFNFSFVSGGSSADIQVTITTAGIATILNPSQYTLVINAVPVGGLWGIGGSVTYPIGFPFGTPLPVGSSLTIQRIVPYEQTVSITNQGPFYPQVVEQALDLLELQLQQLETQLDFTLQFPQSDINPPAILPPAAQRANGFIGFDATGQVTILYTVPSSGGGSPPAGSLIPRIIAVTGTGTTNVLTTDVNAGISFYQSGSAVLTVQLPTTGGPYPIFDGSANAGTYPIKVLPPAGKTIAGQASYTLSFNGQSTTFWNDGTSILTT